MHPLLKLGIVVAVAGTAVLFSMSNFFAIKNYEVKGNDYYSDKEIKVMANCTQGANIFWDGKIADIKERLLKDTYMESVEVKRQLPDTVIINLVEREQLAALVYGEEYIVVDTEGVALRKTDVRPKITVVSGLTISKLTMGEVVEAEESTRLSLVMELLNTANDNNMFFKKIKPGKSEYKCYIFDNLICKGKVKNIKKSIKDGELQLVVQTLLDKKIERGTIEIGSDGYVSFSPEID